MNFPSPYHKVCRAESLYQFSLQQPLSVARCRGSLEPRVEGPTRAGVRGVPGFIDLPATSSYYLASLLTPFVIERFDSKYLWSLLAVSHMYGLYRNAVVSSLARPIRPPLIKQPFACLHAPASMDGSSDLYRYTSGRWLCVSQDPDRRSILLTHP